MIMPFSCNFFTYKFLQSPITSTFHRIWFILHLGISVLLMKFGLPGNDSILALQSQKNNPIEINDLY
jgi:hypothetical protein